MKCKPFAQLSIEIQKRLLDENIELKPRETYPAINTEQYDIIIGFKCENYSVEKRKLKVEYKRNGKQHIFVEMPYGLAKELHISVYTNRITKICKRKSIEIDIEHLL